MSATESALPPDWEEITDTKALRTTPMWRIFACGFKFYRFNGLSEEIAVAVDEMNFRLQTGDHSLGALPQSREDRS